MDKEETKQRWKEYCSERYKEDRQDNTEVLSELLIAPPQLNDAQDNILCTEVERAVKQLQKNKSPGADGVRAEMIKKGDKTLTREIHNMCEQIWTEGRIPDKISPSDSTKKNEIYQSARIIEI